jgi:hypothetical protein
MPLEDLSRACSHTPSIHTTRPHSY